MNRNEIHQRLMEDYARRRQDHAKQEREREREVIAKCPAIGELLSERRETVFASMRRALTEEVTPAAQAELEGKLKDISARARLYLSRSGFAEDYLQPIYDCPACKDTGFVGDTEKTLCECYQRGYTALVAEEIGLTNHRKQTFDTWREDILDDAVLPEYGCSQRQILHRAKVICREYADSFPDTRVKDLVLMGGSGLGKTFLLQAIAQRVLERGGAPLIISSYRFLDTAREAHFQNDQSLLEPLLRTPLLLLDDMGAEPLMENITVAYFFRVLNERQNNGLHTVISTNLSMDEFSRRYTERVSSRLEDKRQCMILDFVGRDVRKVLE